jgi:archaellum component FlaC
MPILNSIFGGCSSVDNNNDDEVDDLKDKINRLEMRLENIERDFNSSFKMLETRVSSKLDILNSKIDNLILLINLRNTN